MYIQKVAVVAVTSKGVETALKIQASLNKVGLSVTVFAPQKYVREGVLAVGGDLADFLRCTFRGVDALVAVMASGIVIRSIAPVLEGKLVDPAVVGVDAAGKYAISLLSGHYGGANMLTRQIAEGIGATPVITTASDSLGKQSVDELARNLHLKIMNPDSLVGVNAALVNGKHVALIKVGNVNVPVTEVYGYAMERVQDFEQATETASNYDAAAIITDKQVVMGKNAKPLTILKPKTIAVGVGARKVVNTDHVVTAIQIALSKANLPIERVDALATVDIKKDSQSLLDAAVRLGFTFEFFTVTELAAVQNMELSADSELVKEKFGIGGVCERAALLKAGKNAHLIVKKLKLNGVTVAVAEGNKYRRLRSRQRPIHDPASQRSRRKR
jgi:cobalt-precorrin 5A hydrolase